MPVQIDFETNVDDLTQAFDKAGDAASWLGDVDPSGLEDLADASTELAEGLEDASEAAEETAEALEDVGDASEGAEKKGKTFREAMKESKQVMGAFNFVMGLGKAALDEVSASADRLGRTELGDNMDKVSGSVNELKDNLLTLSIGGRDTIAWVSDAADGLNSLINVVNISSVAFLQQTGKISDAEASARAFAIAYEPLPLTADQLAQAQRDLADPMDESNRLLRDAKTAAEQLAPVYLGAQGAAAALAAGAQELTTALIFSEAAKNLDAETALKLGLSMGVLNKETVDATLKIYDMKAAADTNKDGFIDASEAANGYTDSILRLSGVLADAALQQAQLNALANAMPGGPGGGVVRGGSGGFASGTHGQWVDVPPGYPNDSYMVPMQSGEQFMVRTPQEISNTNNWGGITVNVQGANVADVLDNLARKADTRTRTQ